MFPKTQKMNMKILNFKRKNPKMDKIILAFPIKSRKIAMKINSIRSNHKIISLTLLPSSIQQNLKIFLIKMWWNYSNNLNLILLKLNNWVKVRWWTNLKNLNLYLNRASMTLHLKSKWKKKTMVNKHKRFKTLNLKRIDFHSKKLKNKYKKISSTFWCFLMRKIFRK